MWSGGVTFGLMSTWTWRRKLIIWESCLFLSPKGMGRHGETTLQKGERFSTCTEFVIFGYTLESMRRVVGRTRGVNSWNEPPNSRPSSWTAFITASLELRYTAIRPFEIREAEITSLAGMVDVRASIYDCIETFSVALKATPLLRVTFLKWSPLVLGTVEVEGPAALLPALPGWPCTRWLCACLAGHTGQPEQKPLKNKHTQMLKKH